MAAIVRAPGAATARVLACAMEKPLGGDGRLNELLVGLGTAFAGATRQPEIAMVVQRPDKIRTMRVRSTRM